MKGRLLEMLREGGYILYARHGEANIGEDWPNYNLQNCNTQRNLSEFGRRQAVYYGEILRYWRIPIADPVIASPFCRTIETAQLAFGREMVLYDLFWLDVYKLSGYVPPAERDRIINALRERLETIPPEGSNQVIIAHGFPTAVGLGRIPNMGTVVIKPLGPGKGYEVIDRLSMEELGSR